MTRCRWKVRVPGVYFPEHLAPRNTDSGALQVGDHTTGNTHDVGWCRTEVVVPRSRGRPHLVVLQQVRVHEHSQLSAVTEGRHAAFVFGNPCLLDEHIVSTAYQPPSDWAARKLLMSLSLDNITVSAPGAYR